MKLSKRVNSLTLYMFVACVLTSPKSHAIETRSSVQKTDVVYEMKQGDSLFGLVAKYFSNDNAIADVIRINQIKNPFKIPVGQKIIFPRDLLIFSPSQARVTSLDCPEPVQVLGENKSLRLGDVIVQGASIKVPKGCEAAITLEDASVVSLLAGASIHIKALRKTPLEKSPEIEFALLGGRIALDVPKRQPGDAPYQVRTPSSLAGVRGTKFSVGFDADHYNSQVEVNHGDVAARGNADLGSRSVRDNQGVAIDALGHAGEVESLPDAPSFNGAEKQANTSSVKLKFNALNPDIKYILSKSANANFVGRTDFDVLQRPEIEDKNLAVRATFYQWVSLSKTGLIGPAKVFGFCMTNATQKIKCNVNFNMHGVNYVDMRLQRYSSEHNSFEEVINAGFNTSKNDQLLFRGLPEGRYQWHLVYSIDGSLNVEKSGDFDLIVVPNK